MIASLGVVIVDFIDSEQKTFLEKFCESEKTDSTLEYIYAPDTFLDSKRHFVTTKLKMNINLRCLSFYS